MLLDVELKRSDPNTVQEEDGYEVGAPLKSRRRRHCTYWFPTNSFHHHGASALVPNVSDHITSDEIGGVPQAKATSSWKVVEPSHNFGGSVSSGIVALR